MAILKIFGFGNKEEEKEVSQNAERDLQNLSPKHKGFAQRLKDYKRAENKTLKEKQRLSNTRRKPRC